METFLPYKIVDKPWGYEKWISLNDRYCLKEIFIKAGHKTSLQYHKLKRETTYIAQGKARVSLSRTGPDFIQYYDVDAGSVLDLPPGDIHRIEALTDVLMFEASTPEVDDVIRLEDSYGRKS